jgi:4-oxalocrotonate tautomerase family enzyme
MPVANINLLRGHSREVLRQIIVETAEVMAEALSAPKDRLIVWITENDPDLWAIGGLPASEVLAEGDRRTLEIPFVQMVLMEGRPKEQIHAVMAGITEVVSRATGIDIGRIRVHVAPAQPDTWSIGGVPAAVARAAELAARARAMA